MNRLARFLSRRWALPSALLALLVLAWLWLRPLPAHAPPAVVVGPPPLAAVRVMPPPAAAPPLGPVADIFAIRNWEPPPPPAAAPAPPQAPPLPFIFLGRIAEPGKQTAYMLSEGTRVRVVSVGDSIGENYRVEKFENGQLLFRYRPMNVRQALDVGTKS